MLIAILTLSLVTQTLGCFEEGIDYHGHDLNPGQYVSTESASACQAACQQTSGCEFWTWDSSYNNACWMKSGEGTKTENDRVTSGPKNCGTAPLDPSVSIFKGSKHYEATLYKIGLFSVLF